MTNNTKTKKYSANNIEQENIELKNELIKAQSLLEQQNNHISYMSSHFGLFWSITGIILVLLGFLSYFQYIKPINEQKEEIGKLTTEFESIIKNQEKEIEKLTAEFESIIKDQKDEAEKTKKESQQILKNIQDNITDYVEKSRFEIALKSLVTDFYLQVGVPILQEYAIRGFKKEQLDELDRFIRKDLQFLSNENLKSQVIVQLFYLFSLQTRNDLIDKLFNDWKNGKLNFDTNKASMDSYFQQYFQK